MLENEVQATGAGYVADGSHHKSSQTCFQELTSPRTSTIAPPFSSGSPIRHQASGLESSAPGPRTLHGRGASARPERGTSPSLQGQATRPPAGGRRVNPLAMSSSFRDPAHRCGHLDVLTFLGGFVGELGGFRCAFSGCEVRFPIPPARSAIRPMQTSISLAELLGPLGPFQCGCPVRKCKKLDPCASSLPKAVSRALWGKSTPLF